MIILYQSFRCMWQVPDCLLLSLTQYTKNLPRTLSKWAATQEPYFITCMIGLHNLETVATYDKLLAVLITLISVKVQIYYTLPQLTVSSFVKIQAAPSTQYISSCSCSCTKRTKTYSQAKLFFLVCYRGRQEDAAKFGHSDSVHKSNN